MFCDHELIEKLYKISGPVLKLRIITELMDKLPCDYEELVQNVLKLPEVQKYIEFYANGSRQESSYCYSKMLHGAAPEKLENTVG